MFGADGIEPILVVRTDRQGSRRVDQPVHRRPGQTGEPDEFTDPWRAVPVGLAQMHEPIVTGINPHLVCAGRKTTCQQGVTPGCRQQVGEGTSFVEQIRLHDQHVAEGRPCANDQRRQTARAGIGRIWHHADRRKPCGQIFPVILLFPTYHEHHVSDPSHMHQHQRTTQ